MGRDSFLNVICDARAERAAHFLRGHPLPDDPDEARSLVAAFCTHMGVAENLWEPYRARGIQWCKDNYQPIPTTWLRKGNRLPVIARESWKDRPTRVLDHLAA